MFFYYLLILFHEQHKVYHSLKLYQLLSTMPYWHKLPKKEHLSYNRYANVFYSYNLFHFAQKKIWKQAQQQA